MTDERQDTAAIATPVPPGAAIATVAQPRPFGYVLGDTFEQRVLLQADARGFEPAAIPPAERAGLWFVRRQSRLETAPDRRRWLVMDYQLANAPQGLMTVNVPAVSLQPKAGKRLLFVPSWPVSISPLTPRAVFARGGLQELRADHAAPRLQTAGFLQQLELSATALAATLLAWFGWWLYRHYRSASNQPFARAAREIRAAGDESDAAWLALHRALDRTAGRSLQSSTLQSLFIRAPWFEAQRAGIERFFEESNLRFFGAGAPTHPARLSARALCASLRQLEKRHET